RAPRPTRTPRSRSRLRRTRRLPLPTRAASSGASTSRAIVRAVAEKEPLLVRAGLRYFRDWHAGAAPVADVDGIHFLNPDERAALRRVTRGAILRAAIAGALSSVLAPVAEV